MSQKVDHVLELHYDPSCPGLEDRVEMILWEHDSSGSLFGQTGAGMVRTAFFDDVNQRSLAALALTALGGIELLSEDRSREDWLARYEQSLSSIDIGRRFVVAPDAHLIEPSERLSLVIPQQRAFGTGSHETTALCLEMLEDFTFQQESRSLDVGTGSGILAIAMARLGGRRIVAFDNDPEVLGVFGDNLSRNGVAASTVTHFVGTIEALKAGARFDLITMNIIPEVIIPILPAVARRTAAGGAVIVSGVLITRRDDVTEAAKAAGFTLRRETTRGEWWCGRLEKG